MISRTPITLLIVALLTISPTGAFLCFGENNSESLSPQVPPLERYKRLWENSPFTLPTNDPNAGEVAGLATQYKLLGLSKAHGDYLVSVLEIASGASMTLGKTPNEKGLYIETVKLNDNVMEMEVTLCRNQEKVALRFDTEAMKTASPQGPAPVPGVMPVGPPQPGTGVPTVNTPPSPPKRIIRRSTGVPSQRQ
ncbi:MAG: hypothetical protein SGI98_09825 [Verrucomicrobiota bacterium]|nr:hypothetical protein [Verrucomicrobiota bacterium]